MTAFTREEARLLMTDRKGPHVSILMPLHPMGLDFQQDIIRFKNLTRRAKEDLLEMGVRAPEVDRILEPAAKLLDAPMYWKQGGSGFALFLAPDFVKMYRVPLELNELASVSNEFHVKPLLRLLHGDGTYFVLALSGNQVRLLQCTRFDVHRVRIPDVPANMAEALKYTVKTPTLQGHTTQGRSPRGGGEATVFHGQGTGIDDQKDDLTEYFRLVDRGLRNVLRGEQRPMVLAGVGYYLPLYQEVNTYPFLHTEPLEGNWEEAADKELQQRSWPHVEPIFEERRQLDAARYLNMLESTLVSSRMDKVLHAACFGRVDTLFVPVGVRRWGLCDRTTGDIAVHDEERAGDIDLLNEAAILTLMRGGTVYAVKPEELPDGISVVNAILRW